MAGSDVLTAAAEMRAATLMLKTARNLAEEHALRFVVDETMMFLRVFRC
ncbi:hypothetical protein [Arthrobacter echini]|nr:hypothetical protein [Arthrobacter echini]